MHTEEIQDLTIYRTCTHSGVSPTDARNAAAYVAHEYQCPRCLRRIEPLSDIPLVMPDGIVVSWRTVPVVDVVA